MDYNAEITKLENMIESLRKRYELFFIGMEKKPPSSEREQVDRKVRELLGAFITNTGQRYRLQSVVGKYNSYQRYWERILQQIEDGTYERELLKRRIIQKEFAQSKYKKATYVIEEDERSAQPPGGGSGGLDIGEEAIRDLFNSYLQVRQTLGEAVGNMSYEVFKRSIEKQIPQLKEKYKTDAIEFKVSIKGGKATIKAVPVEKEKGE